MDVYGNHLGCISDILQRAGFAPSVRGDGTARFVYAEQSDRAVEVYWDGAGFTIELFEQPHDVSLRDEQQDTPAVAAEVAIEWLLHRDSGA